MLLTRIFILQDYLNLHQLIIVAKTPVDQQFSKTKAQICFHALNQLSNLGKNN
jgi:hypothetical protein